MTRRWSTCPELYSDFPKLGGLLPMRESIHVFTEGPRLSVFVTLWVAL